MTPMQLFVKNRKLALWLAGRWSCVGYYSDLLQEAYLGLWIAANKYVPEKGKFATYASRVMRNKLADFKFRRTLSVSTGTSIDWDRYELIKNRQIELRSVYLKKSQDRDIGDIDLTILSDRYRYIVEQYVLHGRDMPELADELGVSRQRISQIFRASMQKLKANYIERFFKSGGE